MKKCLLFIGTLLVVITVGCNKEPDNSGDNTTTDTTAPTISVTSPTDGSTNTSGIINVAGTASDTGGFGEMGVFLTIDGVNVGKIGTTSFNTNINLTNGSHTIILSVYDAAGNYATPVSISIVVNASNTPVAGDDIFFSEYTENGGNNKAVEIYNGTGASVSLDDYFIIRAANAADNNVTWTNGTVIAFSNVAAIADGEVYIVGNESATAEAVIDNQDETSTVTYFNGNDPLALVKDVNTNGTYEDGTDSIIDVIIATTANPYEDVTLVRKSTVTSGNAAFDINEWDQYGANIFDYLGVHPGLRPMPPRFTKTEFANTGGTGCELTVQIDSVGDVYFVVMADGSTQPSATDIKADSVTGSIDSGNITGLTADTDHTFSLTGLTDGELYEVFVLANDSDGDEIEALSLFNAAGGLFTTNNYDFDGGISNVLAIIDAGYDDSGNGTNIALSTTLTGVITLKNFDGESFFIQDQNDGIMFYSTNDPGYDVGTKVAIEVTAGKGYYEMLEIVSFGTITEISTGHQLYYQTVPYTNAGAKGELFRIDATISEAPNSGNYYVGTFDTAVHYFEVESTMASEFTQGSSGTFYGVINYSFSAYRMIIPSAQYYSLN